MGSITILLVDDERDFLDSMAERMKLKGMEVLLAQSGEEALAIAHEQKVDAAVVDLKMPGMDGLVTITKLKEINPKVRTMLLTAFGDEKIKQATEALNSDYFEKGEMNHFWSFIKGLSSKLENSMAAAGMAEEGSPEQAQKIMKNGK